MLLILVKLLYWQRLVYFLDALVFVLVIAVRSENEIVGNSDDYITPNAGWCQRRLCIRENRFVCDDSDIMIVASIVCQDYDVIGVFWLYWV